MTSFRVIIPARFQSSRFPGKVLSTLAAKPILQHVFERAQESGAQSIVIATDDERVATTARGFGAEVCMTSTEHPSGTDRLAETITQLNYSGDDIVVNVQGDEPLIPASLIQQVADNLAQQRQADIATLCAPIRDAEKLTNPHVVKVVRDIHNMAIYFSRASIPYDRECFPLSADQHYQEQQHWQHIGLYSYHVDFIKHYVSLAHADLERLEQLEQLRALYHGHKIHVDVANAPHLGDVNTPADLEKLQISLSE